MKKSLTIIITTLILLQLITLSIAANSEMYSFADAGTTVHQYEISEAPPDGKHPKLNVIQFNTSAATIAYYEKCLYYECIIGNVYFADPSPPDSASTTVDLYWDNYAGYAYAGNGEIGYWKNAADNYVFYVSLNDQLNWSNMTTPRLILDYTHSDLWTFIYKTPANESLENNEFAFHCWTGSPVSNCAGSYTAYITYNFQNNYMLYDISDYQYKLYINKSVSENVVGNSMWTVYNTQDFILQETTLTTTNQNLTVMKNKIPITITAIDNYGNTYTDTLPHGYTYDFATSEGFIYNAMNGTPIDSATASFESPTTTKTGLSNATGYYLAIGIETSTITECNASKSGYSHAPFYFTFPSAQNYNIDFPMMPSANATYLNASIAGVVTSLPYNEPIEDAVVQIANASWNDSTLTTSTGYYFFDGLSADTYTLNASKGSSYDASSNEDETIATDEYRVHSFILNPNLDLTVTVKDLSTSALIQNGSVVVNSITEILSGGQATFTNLDPGTYEVNAESTGYYPAVVEKYVDDFGETTTIYLTASTGVEESGAGAQYPPHKVEFRVIDIWGLPLTDITVTASGTETTVANQTWWEKWLGINPSVDVYNETMTGTTDSAGHISFLMVETVKYQMTFVNASQNISATHEIYPKDDRYTITIGEIPSQKLAYWVTSEQNNTDNTGNLTLHYIDYNDPVKTNWVNFSVYFLDNDTLAYTHNFTSIIDTNENTTTNLNASYIYKIRCVADHDDFGVFAWFVTVGFIMPDMPKLPVVQDLTDELDDWQVTIIGMFILIVFAFIFGAVSSGVGGMVIAFMSSAFYYFGLLPLISSTAAHVIFPLIIVIAILNLMITQKEAR